MTGLGFFLLLLLGITYILAEDLPPCVDPDAKTIVLGIFTGGPGMGWLAALLGNFIKQQTGYDTILKKINGGGRGIKYIETGEVCGSLIGSAPGAYALARGVDSYMPSLITLIGDIEMLVVTDEIENPHDLEGKKIATFVGSTADYHLRLIIDLFGLNGKVEVIDVDGGDHAMQLWDAGEIDGIHAWPPAQTHAMENGGHKLLGGFELASWASPTYNGILFNGAFAREMPKFVEDMINLIGMIGTSIKDKDPFDWADKTTVGFKAIQTITGEPDEGVEFGVGSCYTPTLEEMTTQNYFGNGINGWATKCLKDTTIFKMSSKDLPVLNSDAEWEASTMQGQVPKDAIATGAYKWSDYDLTELNAHIADEDFGSTNLVNPITQQGGDRCSGSKTITADGTFSDGRPASIDGHPDWKPVYHDNADCEFVLESSGKIVEVTFSFFNIDSGHDYVTFTDADGTNLGKFSGPVAPTLVAGKSPLTAHFTSDGSPQVYIWHKKEAGFTADVKFTDGCTSSSCGSHGSCGSDGLCVCEDGWFGADCSTNNCHGKRTLSGSGPLTAVSGNDAYCVWEMTADSGKQVELSFDNFSTEEAFDVVRIYDGSTESDDKLLATWWGSTNPPKVVSTTGSMLLVLESDNLKMGGSFEASFSSVASDGSAPVVICENGKFGPFCDSTYCFGTTEFEIGATGITSGPNRPGGIDCNFQLQTGTASYDRLRFDFTQFDIEPSISSTTDKLEFFVNDETEARVTLTGKTSGCTKPSDCVSGACAIPDGEVFGTCECDAGVLNGDCSISVVEIEATAADAVRVQYTTDMNDIGVSYAGWAAGVSACSSVGTGTYGACEVSTFEYNLLDPATKTIGYVMCGINVLLGIFSIFWVFIHKEAEVVKAAQTNFLMLIAVGTIVSSLSIVPMGMADSKESSDPDVDRACMAFPWMYSVGFIITFSALYLKTRRIQKIFLRNKFSLVTISDCDLLQNGLLILLIDGAVLLAWTFTAPLKWTRTDPVSIEGIHETVVSSTGACEADPDASPRPVLFIAIIAIIHIALMVRCNILLYKCRSLSLKFSETKYVSFAMVSSLQVMLLGVPLLAAVQDNANTRYFVTCGVVFLNDLSVLLFIFVPKIIAFYYPEMWHQEHTKSGSSTDSSAASDVNSQEYN